MQRVKIVLIMTVFLLVPTLNQAFADELKEEILEGVQTGIGGIMDKITENVDVNSDNPLNATKEETDALKESGKKVLGTTLELVVESHELGENAVRWLSPVVIDQIIITVIALFIAGLIAFSILKRLAIHVMLFLVVALAVVGVIIVFLT